MAKITKVEKKAKQEVLFKLPVAIQFGEHSFFRYSAGSDELVYVNDRKGSALGTEDTVYTAEKCGNIHHAFFNKETGEMSVHVGTTIKQLEALLKKAKSQKRAFKKHKSPGFWLHFGNVSMFFRE